MAGVSAQRKRTDQGLVSKDEMKPWLPVIKRLGRRSEVVFKESIERDVGKRFWTRLVKTANRKRLTPWGYVKKHVLHMS